MSYDPPIADILFTMEEVACWRDSASEAAADFGTDELALLLEQAGQIARDVIAPLNQPADRAPPVLRDGAVTMPPGWKDAYRLWTESGWNGIALPATFGGMGLPNIFNAATMEMLTSACFAMGTLPVLAQGAVAALEGHASEPLKQLYLPKLISGEWAATMDLTEPQAGSDLGALRATAVPNGDGSYLIKGQKIFITFGEHDLAENIVHLVLARLPDAPEGTRGISLFLAPKFIPDADGKPGARNDIFCSGVEHKLGIRSSPTCTLVYGGETGARAWLVGEPHRGLACMFTMMNRARLAIGIQGVAIAERALQQAKAYARERVQGRVINGAPGDAIIRHPDVARMLLLMMAKTAAARAVTYRAAAEIDRARGSAAAEALASLLTPLAKAFATDIGVEVASLGIQIHGGSGYIEETGAAQHWRDARIGPIYEGTNGIQAIDFVTRRLIQDGGTAAGSLIREISEIAEMLGKRNDADFDAMSRELARARDALRGATDWMLDAERRPEERLAVATIYLDLFGTVLAGALLAKCALAAVRAGAANDDLRVLTARFYADAVMTAAEGQARSVTGSADILLAALRQLH